MSYVCTVFLSLVRSGKKWAILYIYQLTSIHNTTVFSKQSDGSLFLMFVYFVELRQTLNKSKERAHFFQYRLWILIRRRPILPGTWLHPGTHVRASSTAFIEQTPPNVRRHVWTCPRTSGRADTTQCYPSNFSYLSGILLCQIYSINSNLTLHLTSCEQMQLIAKAPKVQ